MPNYTGQALADWILAILGNVLLVGLAIGVASTAMKSQWGQMFGFIAGGIIAAVFVWSPDVAKEFLRTISNAFFAAGV